MNDIDQIINGLEQTPLILRNLLESIPVELLKAHRIPNKWSIHEHVCHLAQAERMIIDRFEDFKNIKAPQFKPYLPGKTVSSDGLLNLEIKEEMLSFERLRNSLVTLTLSFDRSIWTKPAEHHEYSEYSAYILLRHTLMHDHFHMYRIEELWLTKPEYLAT